MEIIIKTPEEIAKMRVAGRLAAQVLEMIEPFVKAGITTNELDRICHDYIVNDLAAIPAPLNYRGFPKSICTSINHVVCHGIPSDKKLKQGISSISTLLSLKTTTMGIPVKPFLSVNPQS
jgi:methionyl aminopeptidase